MIKEKADGFYETGVEHLVARVFATRDISHLKHFKTQSYSQHIALDEFYHAIVEQVDKIVECYQGRFDRIGTVSFQVAEQADILIQLTTEMKWIEMNRLVIANGSSAIENLIDELIATYAKTLYKLRNLK